MPGFGRVKILYPVTSVPAFVIIVLGRDHPQELDPDREHRHGGDDLLRRRVTAQNGIGSSNSHATHTM